MVLEHVEEIYLVRFSQSNDLKTNNHKLLMCC